MRKIYHLSTCSTCKRILKELDAKKHGFLLQDIKTEPISSAQLAEMKEMAGSYEALFSRRAMKYKSLGLKDKELSEVAIKQYILSEYTFLKRPVILIEDQIFVGNSKKVVASAIEYLKQ